MYYENIINNTKLILKVGDITEEEVDAIVNAANSSLSGGGGVDGAIHRKGGPEILKECKAIGYLSPGNAVITSAGRLKARYVIHTVGPIYRDGLQKEEEVLKNAYFNTLSLAKKYGIKKIAFPSISTGAYGYPVFEAALVALKTVIDFLKKEAFFSEVIFVLYREEIFNVYRKVFESCIKDN